MENFAPFYVGQRVVCINNAVLSNAHLDPSSVLVKGKVYTITSVTKGCCGWSVTIGIPGTTPALTCHICGKTYLRGVLGEWSFIPERFAPIQEDFQSITLEKILEQETQFISVN